MHECPKCGAPMDLSGADPDVGIMSSAWICEACDYAELADEDQGDD
jgi:C4-type Zn-finger protein